MTGCAGQQQPTSFGIEIRLAGAYKKCIYICLNSVSSTDYQNMAKIFLRGIVPMALLAVLTACSSDEEAVMSKLSGRWLLREAISNGRPTERMSSLYYEFNRDGSLSTNLTGSPQQQAFELDGNQLTQLGDPMTVQYEIVKLEDTVLVLKTQINQYDFMFTFGKQTNTAQ